MARWGTGFCPRCRRAFPLGYEEVGGFCDGCLEARQLESDSRVLPQETRDTETLLRDLRASLSQVGQQRITEAEQRGTKRAEQRRKGAA